MPRPRAAEEPTPLQTDRPPAAPGRLRSILLPAAAAGAVLVAALAGCSSGPERADQNGDRISAAGATPADCSDRAGSSIVPLPTTAPADDGGADLNTGTTTARIRLAGRAIDGRCRTPIAGAAVFVFAGLERKDPARTVFTDADGRFQLELPRDRYRVAFAHAGLNYDYLWYPAAADYDGATEVALRGDTDLGDVELYHPEDQPVPPYSGDGNRRIAVIGDSLVQQSTTAIERQLDLIGPASVRGIAAQRFGDMQPTAERFAATDPDTVVIALGSNDVNQNNPIAESLAAFEKMVATLDRARCLVVFDVNSHSPIDGFTTRATYFNDAIRRLAETNPKIHLVGWDETVAGLLNWAPRDEWFSDDLHLSARGIDVYARTMAAAVSSC